MSNPDLAFKSKRKELANGFLRRSARPGASSAFKLKGMEGWRGIACLLVVVFHVWQTMDGPSNNGVGPYADNPAVFNFYYNVDIVVDLFFVLSGLLLFLPFAAAALDDNVSIPSARNFFFRRMLRLLPVYWIVVLFAWFPRNYGFGTAQWVDLLEHLFLVQAFDSERIFYTIGPAWTLSVELVFYISLALFAPSFVRWVRENPYREGRMERLIVPLLGVITLSVLYKFNVEMVWAVPVTDWAWRFGPAAKADDFALGMILAVAVIRLKDRALPSYLSPLLIGLGATLIYFFLYRFGQVPSEEFLAVRHTMMALGWTLILAGVTLVKTNIPARIVDNGPAVALSVVAYSVYLVHEPLLLALVNTGFWSADASLLIPNTIAVMALTLFVAWLVHRLIEEPWTDLGALQDKNGGRKELYSHITEHDSKETIEFKGSPALRTAFLARLQKDTP